MTHRQGSLGRSHQPSTDVGRHRPQGAGLDQPVKPMVPRPRPGDGAPPPPESDLVRYGPGVPGAAVAGQTGADTTWRGGRLAGPSRRRDGLRPVLGLALTVILLAVAGVVIWLRFFDHPPFRVTG